MATIEYLTSSDVARILGVTPDAVRAMERSGRLPAARTPGGVRLFSRADVEAFAAGRDRRLAGEEEQR